MARFSSPVGSQIQHEEWQHGERTAQGAPGRGRAHRERMHQATQTSKKVRSGGRDKGKEKISAPSRRLGWHDCLAGRIDFRTATAGSFERVVRSPFARGWTTCPRESAIDFDKFSWPHHINNTAVAVVGGNEGQCNSLMLAFETTKESPFRKRREGQRAHMEEGLGQKSWKPATQAQKFLKAQFLCAESGCRHEGRGDSQCIFIRHFPDSHSLDILLVLSYFCQSVGWGREAQHRGVR